jgi:hypothetical protein
MLTQFNALHLGYRRVVCWFGAKKHEFEYGAMRVIAHRQKSIQKRIAERAKDDNVRENRILRRIQRFGI